MRILTVLERNLEERFIDVVDTDHELKCARTWSTATRILRSDPIDIAVFDPGLSGDPTSEEAERFASLFPSLPLMVYARLSPTLPAVMLRLGGMGVRRVILAWTDDHPDRVATLLMAESRQTLVAQLSQAVAELLNGCPQELVWAVERMIREPASVHTVQHLARSARMDRRSCARWFDKSNLTTPSNFIVVVRLVHARHLLQDPGYSVDDVAKKLGYSQSRTFSQNVRQFFGMSPGEFRTMLSPEDVLAIAREKHLGGRPKHLSIVS